MANYLSQENIFGVADTIYKYVNKTYDINVQGYYLEDIQKLMGKLWEKNKNKKLKRNQNIKDLHSALNKKVVELLIPQVKSTIEGGYLNQKNNIMFSPKNNYEYAHDSYQPPQSTNSSSSNIDDAFQKIQMERDEIYPKQEKVTFKEDVPSYQDTAELYERMRKERESTDTLTQMTGVPHNKYSSENIQNRKVTYDNSLPKTNKIMENSDRYINGEPVYNNEKNNLNEYFNNNHPSDFSNNNQDTNQQLSQQQTYENVFSNNLSGIETSVQSDNNEVEQRFQVQKKMYEQEGSNPPKNSSNYVEDVMGTSTRNNNEKDKILLQNTYPNQNTSSIEGFNNNMFEGFQIQDPENKTLKQNRNNAEKDLEINNLLTENANINYPLIAPENTRYITRKYYLSVDSLQRDLEHFPLPTNFQVRFEQPDEEIEVPSYLNQNGVVIYEKPMLFQNVGGKGAKMETIYENIVELKCLDAQIPFDRYFVGGTSPYKFNGPKIDENKENQLAFTSYPYGPIWEQNYGIEVDILDEPFYYLVVDEIDGAYDGTNLASRRALAKLNYDKMYGFGKKFLNLRTTALEGKIFYPTNLAKLSQMTLKLVTRFSRLLDVGVDKVYVEKVEKGEEVTEDGLFCPLIPGQHLTKITIISDDPEYGQELCSHNNIPGDRLLFYSIYNCDPFIQYTKLSKNIYIKFLDNSGYDGIIKIYFYMVYGESSDIKEKKVDATAFLREKDLIILNNKYMLDIVRITDGGYSLLLSPRIPFDTSQVITHKGFIRTKKSGNNNENKKSLLYEAGHRVGGKLSNRYTFQILYPYECVPDYLRDPVYKPKELFYIHAKKQITYTFQVTQVEQNMENLDSRMVPR